MNFCRRARVGSCHTHFQPGAAQEFLDTQLDFLGEVAVGSAGAGGGLFARREFTVVVASARRVAEDFIRGVQGLSLRNGNARTAVHIGVMLLREQAVGRADLRIGAAPVETQRGVMIWYGGLQGRQTTVARAEIPARRRSALGLRSRTRQLQRVQNVVIHSDGACHGNPGPGGWAAVLTSGSHVRELSGGVAATTNNRMELQAAIEALKALKQPCKVAFHTDSSYLRDGITKWLRGWKRNGWRTQAKQSVKNEDLWRLLDAAASAHQVNWHWVKGHAGDAGNERCDALATAAIVAVKASHSKQQLAESLREFNASQKAAADVDLLPLG